MERFWPAAAAGLLTLFVIVGWGVLHNRSIVRQLVTIAVGLVVGVVVTLAVFIFILGNITTGP